MRSLFLCDFIKMKEVVLDVLTKLWVIRTKILTKVHCKYKIKT